ncbi:AbiJ-NTD4 domain-containing protein [Chromobacterium piscinae]|uniref:AbiJ-NTD4 domain-containing protein n=1 Tax=Chromobacterium piscinae TaxID=686831 RepID=UPI003F8126A3
MRFSERYGYKEVRELVQLESMDEPLRNALWNLLKIHIWDYVHPSIMYREFYLSDVENAEVNNLCRRIWFSHFKFPLDNLVNDWNKVYAYLRGYFFESEWYEVYDFIEFVADNYERHGFRDRFISSCNSVLEQEISAYRFVDGIITRITEHQEVCEIEDALEKAIGPVQVHLRRALELLSNREQPDYRNSIKESISSVESLVAVSLHQEKGTLGQLLKRLEDEIKLHPALKSAFNNLYGYTSDADGIRHGLLEAESVKFEDAKFFLVACSAFINFVTVKLDNEKH